jgi:hypothetical protein
MATDGRRTLVGLLTHAALWRSVMLPSSWPRRPGDRPQVEARCERLGCRIVARRVQARIDAEAIREPRESTAHRTGVAWPGPVRHGREREAGAVQRLAGRHEGAVPLGLVLVHQHDRRGIDRYPAHLVAFRSFFRPQT